MESKGINTSDAESTGLEPTTAPEPAYSTFSSRQKAWIVFLVALAGMFSPMSSFVFYPAIDAISKDLHVTVGLVNLAVTIYMIVSGIVPPLMGSAADKFGRRPIYALALSVYFVANLGLALQDTYVGLLLLRMLQSAGSSGLLPCFIHPPLSCQNAECCAEAPAHHRHYISWVRGPLRHYYSC